jgi:aspartate racemase
VSIPVLDMIEITVRTMLAQTPGLARVGLLASTAVIGLGLYDKRFARRKVALLTPAEAVQTGIMAAIKTIKTSRYGREVVDAIQAGADDLLARGAEALLVACTEISIVGRQIQSDAPVYDASQILAEAIVREASRGMPPEE